ncbi:DUF874 family protein [Helicobacter pylori]|uniref:DUF874 family protein n=1 Tax=Helicobacter pylori TaxID=210 RepID=UPI000329EC96|nr:DUF874 family protein [Helicobacter pylori]AIP91743.1 hypothetical protein K751_09095 [Helicobacter pylori UM066]EQK96236.1 hypothetical protein N201_01915 [Helicobacter pylori UM066]
MESVKTGKTNKVGKNTEMAHTKTNKETHFKQVSAITNTLKSIGGIFTKIAKKVRELVKKHPKKSKVALVVLIHAACKRAKELDDKVQDKSKQAEKENQINWWKYSGLTIATSLLLAACSAGDIDKQIELEQEKQKTEQEQQKTSNIETNNQIKVEQEKQKTNNTQKDLVKEQKDLVKEQKDLVKEQKDLVKEQKDLVKEQKDLVKEQKDLVKEQKDFIKYAEQNCQEKHNQFFIKKAGIKGGAIEVEAECKTPKPTKTNQTPIQPKHLPNSKQPRSQRGSKAQELIAYLQKELESLPYSQKAIARQVDFYKPSSIAYLELDPRDFSVTEEWQKENLKIRSKAQAKMLEMRHLKPDPQAHLSTSQSLLLVQKIFADINKEIEAAANTEKKAEKAGYGYSKRV